jgi:multiple sugar transport system ATP-binding protein
MGRAIVRDPQAFLMDEPLSNLDAKLRIQMRAEILRIQRRLGATTVYVTHDQTEAMTLGDRLAVMRHGVLQQVGTPGELYERPNNAFVAGFIGAPSMNFLSGEITEGALRFPLGAVPVEQVRRAGVDPPASGGRVVVGIRPEDFLDAPPSGGAGGAVRVRGLIDVLESTGSDLYAHLTAPGANGSVSATERQLIAEAAGAAEADVPTSLDIIARLGAGSRLTEGQEGELWVQPSKLHLFDPDSGARL